MAIDTTIGSATANSYPTVLEADAYFLNRFHVSFWASLPNEDKEKLLITATSLLDWYVKWAGLKVSDTQALAWPRTGVYTELGNEISSSVIPAQVKTAVFELIIASYEADRTSDSGLEGLSMLKLSSLQIQATDKYANPPRKVIPESVWKILGELCVKGGISVVRLVRA